MNNVINRSITNAPLIRAEYDNIVYGTDSAEQSMDVYLPANRDSLNTGVVIMIHGGGWIGGDKSTLTSGDYDDFFNENGSAVININYRLIPKYAYPAAIDDISMVLEYIKNKQAVWKINSSRICLFGFSAGGQLALAYAYKYNSEKRIKAVIDVSGITDFIDSEQNTFFIGTLDSAFGNYTANKQQRHDASPINYTITAVPTVIIHGTSDPYVPFSQAQLLYDSLRQINIPERFIPIAGGGHGITDSNWLNLRVSVLYRIKNYL